MRRMFLRRGTAVVWFGTHMYVMHHSFFTDGLKSCSLLHLLIFREAFNTSHKYLGWLLSLFFFQLCVHTVSLTIHHCCWWSHLNNSWYPPPPRPSSQALLETLTFPKNHFPFPSRHFNEAIFCLLCPNTQTCNVWFQSDLMKQQC